MSSNRRNLLVNIFALAFGMAFFGGYAVKLGQDVNYDLLNYHFYNAYAFLGGRLGFDYAVANIQQYLNPLLDLPFYILATHLKPELTGFFMGAIQGLNFWLLFALAYSLIPSSKPAPRALMSAACAFAGMLGPMNISELGTTFSDNMISIPVLAALLVMARKLGRGAPFDGPGVLKAAVLAGFFAGVGAGLKLVGLIYVLGGALAFFALPVAWKQRSKASAAWCIGSLGGLLASSGYWMFLMWHKFGNPTFPFYNNIFKSPYASIYNFNDKRFFPKSIAQWLFYPFYLIDKSAAIAGEKYFRDFRLAAVFTLIVIAACVLLIGRYYHPSRNTKKGGANETGIAVNAYRFILAFFVCSYVVWEMEFSIYRYALPLELVSPIVAALLLAYLIKDRTKWTAAALALLVAMVMFTKPADWGRFKWGDTLFGVETPVLQDPDHTIIIMPAMGRSGPTSYIIPYFPKGIRFIRLESWLFNKDQHNMFQPEIREILARHKGPIYLLTRNIYEDNESLKSYNLAAGLYKPLKLRTRMQGGFLLYPVSRRPAAVMRTVNNG